MLWPEFANARNDLCFPLAPNNGRPRAFDREQALNQAPKLFWKGGFEPAGISDLCSAMGINPPSLYAAFGNKAKLFLEAVHYYEATYWDATWERMASEADVHRAVSDFFRAAEAILTSQDAPCGCMVVMADANLPESAKGVYDELKSLRVDGRDWLLKRLEKAGADGQLRGDTDFSALASTLNTLLHGLSIQARDGASREELEAIGKSAATLVAIAGVVR